MKALGGIFIYLLKFETPQGSYLSRGGLLEVGSHAKDAIETVLGTAEGRTFQREGQQMQSPCSGGVRVRGAGWTFETGKSEKVVQCEMGDVGTCLVGHYEDFGFHSGFTGKALKNFKKGR